MKEFLFKSTVKSKQSISKEICCAEHAYMNIHTLPPIITLATALL